MAESKEDLAGALLGMGNPLLDISADVTQEELDRWGVTLNNAILAEEKHVPLYSTFADTHEVKYTAGGATQNTIRVAQWMSGIPGFTSYIGCVGKDKFGSMLRDAAAADGVAVHYLEDEETPTGTCAVLIKDHERSLVANIAAANKYSPDHLHAEATQKVVHSSKVQYISGFFLTVSPDSMVELGTHAAETGKVFAMNLAAPFLPAVFKDAMQRVLPYCDIVFGNESESAAYAEANGYAGASIEDVATNIAKQSKASGLRGRLVVLTQGSGPTIVCQGGKISSYDVEKIPEEEMVDLNGAGDAFVGGFLLKYIQGADIAECVRAGQWAAGYIIRRSGIVMEGACTFE